MGRAVLAYHGVNGAAHAGARYLAIKLSLPQVAVYSTTLRRVATQSHTPYRISFPYA